ncbi:MAG: M20 family metallopeptidase [Planctomycetota bacterium]|nr:M20 family metallopeptidase [Planctomycetota bacterium]
MTNVVEILKSLIAIPSVNPMGRDLTGDQFLETRLTEHLAHFFRDLGVPYEVIEVVPGRSNVIARFDASPDRPTVVLDAHQDTVPVDDMIIDPFDPIEADGRIQGRGSCDVKGGMAAMLAAFARLVREKPADRANVVMTCACDEEATILGISDLVRLWEPGDIRSKLLSDAPDMAIVAEPTNLHVVVAHRGATRWTIRTEGRACHSSDPDQGVNAVYRMARVLTELENYAANLKHIVAPHPLCGCATLSVGMIRGGISVNTVPAECEIEVDRRGIPGEDGTHIRQHVIDYLSERLPFEVQHGEPWLVGLPLPDDTNGELADRLLAVIEPVAGPREKIGVFYGSHASRFAASGVSAVVFGPGSIQQAHTKDEWVSIDELHSACEIYYRVCANLSTCGR